MFSTLAQNMWGRIGRLDAGVALRRVGRFLEIILVVGSAYIIARLIWLLAFGASATQIGVGAPTVSRVGPLQIDLQVDVDRLPSALLFADRTNRETELVRPVAEIPETQLNLVLRGVRSGQDATTGTAIIQASDNSQRNYRVDDEIQDGVILTNVYTDRVIIRRNGVSETLRLRTDDAPGASSSRSGSSSSGQMVSDLFQVEPVIRGSSLIGYRISTNASQMMQVFGLNADDIITAVDETRLADVEDVAEFFEGLAGRDRITLSVLRGGVPMTLQVDLP